MKSPKNILKQTLILLLLSVAASCARHKIIPDKTLALIFRDAFITNAYIENRRISTDSLDFYGPLFARYGYTVDDVQYTIGNFSKRKNARLGDVVEETIKMLEEEGLYYEREAAIMDTVDNIARRTFRRTLLADSLIKVSRLRDTDRLHLRLEGLHPGEYRVEFEYRIDSLDNMPARRAFVEFERADSSRFGRQQANLYRNNRTERFSRTMHADTSVRAMIINLSEFTKAADHSPKRTNRFGITVNTLSVVYTPETEAAVDSLFERQLPLRVFFRDFFPSPSEEPDEQ